MQETLRKGFAALVVAAAACMASPAETIAADDLPPYLKMLTDDADANTDDVANKDVLQLNTSMFELYDDASRIFKRRLLAEHPMILALFSGAGGRFILYRPGMAPLEAPPVPMVYQLLKSIGHSTMALAEVAIPYVGQPGNPAWRGSMHAYRSRMQSALDSLDASAMPAEWRANNRSILENNLAFMDTCLARGVIGQEDLASLARQQGPLLKKNVAWAAQTQVAHWMGVLDGWKQLLGASWEQAYAASNTIYVARQNNVLFSVLAQYFGPDAINDRLMLIETISFTTTPDDMLDSLTRIIADRSVGALFFNSYHLMDSELMGGDARAAIIAESAKRGVAPFLPPQVPFGSHQWPMLITPGTGPGSLAELP